MGQAADRRPPNKSPSMTLAVRASVANCHHPERDLVAFGGAGTDASLPRWAGRGWARAGETLQWVTLVGAARVVAAIGAR